MAKIHFPKHVAELAHPTDQTVLDAVCGPEVELRFLDDRSAAADRYRRASGQVLRPLLWILPLIGAVRSAGLAGTGQTVFLWRGQAVESTTAEIAH